MAPHGLELVVGYVLQCDVEIFAYIVASGHHIKDIHREVGRIGVMQPDPFHSRNICDRIYQFRQMMPAVKIHAVRRQILGYDIEFFYAAADQIAYFARDFLNRA